MNFTWTPSPSQNKIYTGYFLIDFDLKNMEEPNERQNLMEMYEHALGILKIETSNLLRHDSISVNHL